MTIADAVVLAIAVAGVGCASLRWLRVAQREHYLAGETLRFSWRWWRLSPDNRAVALGAIAAAVASIFFAPVAAAAALAAATGPIRLPIRGRTSRLAWTRRMATVALVSGLLEALAIAIGALAAGLGGAVPAAALTALAVPGLVDVALFLTKPFENAVAHRYVARASQRLERVRPVVVGVTGSYGKTTVKGYIAHLVGGQRTTLASPKSYNNRAGLAKTVNELLGPATEVFVAEMGTYGPGEIAELCSWLRPTISVITAIGPAHLERFKSLDVTLAAKAEIAERARLVVVNVDDERLAGLAKVLREAGRAVVGASGTNEVADVAVLASAEGLELRLGGRRVGVAAVREADQPAVTSNAACAAAVARELGLEPEDILARLASLPVAPNRLQRYPASNGYLVLDDTFNSNPAGAKIALARLAHEAEVDPKGRRVIVTPGMVELGALQMLANEDLGEAAARVADRLVIVARTNRGALAAGAAKVEGGAQVAMVDRIDEALDWVRSNLGPGDAVLYENDLPDHYP